MEPSYPVLMALTYNNTSLLLIIVTVVAEESQDQFNFVRVLVDIAENII